MTYGRLLEKRDNGIYYFRQVFKSGNKQVARRFSLRTTDIKVARFLALQFKARIEMINYDNIKKFDVIYDENGNIKSVKVKNGEDAQNLNEFLKLQELHKAESHKRDIEKMKFQQAMLEKELQKNEQEKYLASPKGQEMTALYDKLQTKLKPKENTDQLTPLKNSYISNLTITENSKYKYDSFIAKFIKYAVEQGVYTLEGVDRKLVYSYVLFLRKTEKKTDNTIKNILNPLSTFFNHLISVGETTASNPFSGHKLNTEDSERLPFTLDEIEKIFTSQELQNNKKLFFICLLLLTTGARPNEICQLWTDDIIVGEEITTIRITADQKREQTLKNKQSDRVIYLNEIVESFGFLDYFKNKKLGMIFDLKKPTLKNFSTFISLEFTEILRSLGVEKKTMYCFRHTTINRIKQALIIQSVSEDLVGHEGKGTNAKVYSQQHSPENLKEITEKLLQYAEVPFFKNHIEKIKLSS